MENLFDRLSTGLSADLRALSLTGPRARGALRTSLAVVLATLVALGSLTARAPVSVANCVSGLTPVQS